MCRVLATLLCVGLLLFQGSQELHCECPLLMNGGQDGSLSAPRVTVEPDSLILARNPVTITCKAPPNAQYYRISKLEKAEDQALEECLVGNTLQLAHMTSEHAGLYICSYSIGHTWSPCSQPLPLVMTGAYEKPTLSSMAGPVVSEGLRMEFRCFSRVKFDEFLFIKESGAHTPQTPSPTADGGHMASFFLDPVTISDAGSYKCFGRFHKAPFVWSQPSDPCLLQVNGAPFSAPTTLPTQTTEVHVPPNTEQPPLLNETTALPRGPPTTGLFENSTSLYGKNWITTGKPQSSLPLTDSSECLRTQAPRGVTDPHRAVLIGAFTATALLLLLLLLFLLLRRYRVPITTWRQARATHGQSTDAAAPKEVTYSQVAYIGTVVPKPSALPTDTHHSEYATLALR